MVWRRCVCWWVLTMSEREVRKFNESFPAGTPVRFWPGARVGEGQVSRTRGQAWVLCGTAVVSVEDYAGGIALTHVDVIGHERVVRVETFKQFVDRSRRETARRQCVSLARVRRELGEHVYVAAWRDQVVRSFNDGAVISSRLWRSMDEGLRYRVLRCPRALRDDDLTRVLRGLDVG